MKSDTFSKIAIESGVNDITSVSKIYHGILRHIRRELGEGRSVQLEELGKFEPKMRKGKKIFIVTTQEYAVSEDTVQVKFTPCANLKKYVRVKNDGRKDSLT